MLERPVLLWRRVGRCWFTTLPLVAPLWSPPFPGEWPQIQSAFGSDRGGRDPLVGGLVYECGIVDAYGCGSGCVERF